MGETIIVFTLLYEIRNKRANIDLPKLYDAQGDERQGNQTARLCLLEDTADFLPPDFTHFEGNIYYIQHAGSAEDTKKRQSQKLSEFADRETRKLFRHNKNFSHGQGDPVWDCIADICSDKPSVNKSESLAALTKHIKESHFCRSLDDLVALVWLSDIVGQPADLKDRIDKISFADTEVKRDLLTLAESDYVTMRVKAEQLWLEH